MSLMHSIINYFLKCGKRTYDPKHPRDYPAARAAELHQNKYALAPKSVQITEDCISGVPVELLTKPQNPKQRNVTIFCPAVQIYLHYVALQFK